ncbi:uncharacterized protein LOC123396037 [Hordeum vulgare subsp. vulgare]|uniref:Uncharacterized protein n=2 Tax=Hordeum vulgare subsp. vulgare TaxID=112509 RepID=A0A8I6XSY2_HORVV|nr:uncharacterized protein LOC123396037 [Hordeum vulgare subsp. vulgare]KAI4990272.1 hypothetical protein ZWY2020_038635 [Hordeum vulgare]
MGSSASLCLVITLLAFYFLVPSNAIPLSRVQRQVPLQHVGDQVPWVEESTPKPKMDMGRVIPEDAAESVSARMMLETQDYAPSGPNNHHKPPGWN